MSQRFMIFCRVYRNNNLWKFKLLVINTTNYGSSFLYHLILLVYAKESACHLITLSIKLTIISFGQALSVYNLAPPVTTLLLISKLLTYLNCKWRYKRRDFDKGICYIIISEHLELRTWTQVWNTNRILLSNYYNSQWSV